MKFVCYYDEWQSLEYPNTQVDLILTHQDLSPYGNGCNDTATILEQLKSLKSIDHQANIILDWDLPLTWANEKRCLQALTSLPLHSFDAIRVQDFAALVMLKDLGVKTPIHFLAQKGHHNLLGICSILEQTFMPISRFVFSTQIPLETLRSFLEHSELKNIETELFVLGPLLMYHSPREMFTPGAILQEHQVLSIEDGNKAFYFSQNKHGTFMYHTKDLYLLDFWNELHVIGLTHATLRMPHPRQLELGLHNPPINRVDFMKQYPRGIFNGLFGKNKTDVLFPKLKSFSTINMEDAHVVGQVIDLEKNNHTIITFDYDFEILPEKLFIQNPNGKIIPILVENIKTLQNQPITQIKDSQIYKIPYYKSCLPSSLMLALTNAPNGSDFQT